MDGNDKNKYFNAALRSFAQDVAVGGAIRHLTDLGYTAEEIRERLDFPIALSEVERIRRERLIDTGVLPPDDEHTPRDYEIVKEQTKYGRVTFRRVEKAR